MSDLRFGTDGWRDRMDGRFTHANVARAAHATAEHVRDGGGRAVAVAFDGRQDGAAFARTVADVLAAHGLTVHLASAPLPTPVLSFAVAHLGLDAGVMLTASHNPPAWNGFKLKGPYGGTATDATYRDVAARVARTPANVRPTDARPSDVRPSGARPAGGGPVGDVVPLDVRAAYVAHVATLLDLDLLRRARGALVHDAMHGAAAGWIAALAHDLDLGVRVDGVRANVDPTFGGGHPEPVPAELGPAVARLRDPGDAWLGVATDGDGDRVAAVLPGGRVATAHETFALLLDQRLRAGRTGRVVRTFTVARNVERLAAARGLPQTETPVGFKWLVGPLREDDVLIAGEESGGIGLPEHLPERDGIVNGLLLLQAALEVAVDHGADPAQGPAGLAAASDAGAGAGADAGGALGVRLAELEAETGWRHRYDRRDLPLPHDAARDAVVAALADDPATFGGRTVHHVERRDGVKLGFEDGAWLLIRASGTEPLLRLYVEAHDDADVAAILDAAEAFVKEVETT